MRKSVRMPGAGPLARAGAVALVVTAVFGATSGGAATTSVPGRTDGTRCKLPTGYPTAPVGANAGVTEDGAPQTTCIKTTVVLLGSASEVLPKVGQSGRVRVSIQADAALATGSYRVRIRIPNGISPGKAPAGFTTTAFVDPFSTSARANSGDDGSHAFQLTGKAALSPGKTTTVTVPVTMSRAGSGRFDVTVDNSSAVGGTAAVEFPGGVASAGYTYDATGTREGLKSYADEATQGKPADWNANAPSSLDIPARELTGWSSAKAANYKRPSAPLDSQGNCPGGLAKQDNGICPGVGSEKYANQNVRRIRSGRASVGAHVAATTCMDGQLVYSDMTGTHPSINVPVEAWDVNTAIDDHIGDAITDWDGNFHICFSNSENGWFESGTADVKLVFISSTNRFRVVNNCCWSSGWTPGTYNIETSTRSNVPSGTVPVGPITATDPNFQTAYHAFDILNRAWAWSNAHSPGAGDCWSNGECNRKTAMWWPTSTEWPHYGGTCAAHVGSILCLRGDAPDDVHTILHEIGHNVMDDVYGIPPHDCPSTHYGWVNEERGCAWTEGWPSYYASAIEGQPITSGFRSVSPTPNDNLGWSVYRGIARGANVENRIVSALWDIQDSNNEGVWDRMSEGDQVLWDAFRKRHPQDWEGMITAMAQEGINTDSTNFRSTLYGNTIDMASAPFRDPLTSGTWASRTLPPVSQPSLSAMNPGVWSPGSNSATPVNTSNAHAFSWYRPGPSACTDTIEVQNVGSWSSGYMINNILPRFPYNGFTVAAYSNSNMTGQLAAASTGSQSLFAVGSLALSLPASPMTVYVRTSGQVRATPISDGDWMQVPDSQYRIRANKCSPFSIARPWSIVGAIRSTAAAELAGGKSYTVTWNPAGKSSTGKAQKASIRVGNEGWSAPCLKDTQTGGQCANGDATVGRPLAVVSSTSTNAGRALSLKFTPQQGGVYEFEFSTSTGPGSGSVTVTQG